MRNQHQYQLFRCILIVLVSMGLFLLPNTGVGMTDNRFEFSPKTLKWKAINDDGRVVRTGFGSGGRHYCPDIKRSCRTPTGTFKILSMRGHDCRSSRYPVGKGGAPMPYCAFFTQYYAVHGSYEVPDYNASHGCVRIEPTDAKWLSSHFFHVGTTVVIKPY